MTHVRQRRGFTSALVLVASAAAVVAAGLSQVPAVFAAPAGTTASGTPSTAAGPTTPGAGATAAPASAPSAPLTPDTAYALVVRPVWSQNPRPKPEQLAEARKVLETAAKADPKNIRWSYALAHTSWLEAESTSGKEAEAKRKQAKEAFGAVVEREPGSTDYQYWYAVTCFEMIDDVGMLSKAGLASTGRKAFEKAIEIDPNNVSARYGLGVFFYKAPGIAGGSNAKAKAQGEALLSVPGGRGEYWGRMLLAQIAIADKNWTEMSKQLTAAETAKGDGANPAAAFQTQIFQLLGAAKNPSAALPVIARYRAAAKPDENAPDYLEGLARSQMGQCETAVVSFEKVLARTADARNTRYELAACYEKLGNRAEAKKNYDEFAKRFPADDRAQKAKDASKRLS